ncbi:peptide/nickel transport system ATP-binding protein [Filimonas lacunae]|uniref:Peptide/nickel transport system ATP-binding protein n=1 Tax=Filimonas lacunae TaxID=477680 RepID=A0A173MAV1_9BACT|nr:ABC transporter ATP-binding protein [Filimonas lacunae]BAV04662.1 oligopeptide transport ATP-binding protein OppF [Filimonas lacunae]SIT32454.1 peptide/nickel transport system ATP-binding protein [Filimonas lacunae]
MSQSRSPLLQVAALSVAFQQHNATHNALQRVSVTVNKGELVAVVGESGSGKSVTSLSVLRLLPSPPALYTHGHIWYTQNNNSLDLLQATPAQIRQLRGKRIAMIFQEPMTSLNPVRTCGSQVMEALRQHTALSRKQAYTQTIHLFTQVQLPDPERIFKSYPHQISGGQKQRAMIAMAMSCQPELLICDEPTTALDVTVQKSILQLIKQLQQQQQMGVLFITHDLGVVAEIADRIVVMYKGQVVEEGTTHDIFTQPQHPYTQALLACRPALYPRGQRLPVVSDFLTPGESSSLPDENNTVSVALTIASSPASITTTETASNSISDNINTVEATPLITVTNLEVWYPRSRNFFGKATAYTKAVNDVSFQIYEGETLGLVGESGCGKSTLGRALLRLVAPTSGEITFGNESLNHMSESRLKEMRRQMQIIFQDPYSSLNPRKPIGSAIAEVLKVHGIGNTEAQRKTMVIELLQKVNLLPEHFNRYPHEFSGGQRQRIVIARALALQPSFVVCDESVSALDVSVQAQVLNLLNDLKKEFRFTSVFISHDLSVVKYISDRIMVMNKGQIEECGPAEQVYNHPKSSYTQQLIAAAPQLSL